MSVTSPWNGRGYLPRQKSLRLVQVVAHPQLLHLPLPLASPLASPLARPALRNGLRPRPRPLGRTSWRAAQHIDVRPARRTWLGLG